MQYKVISIKRFDQDIKQYHKKFKKGFNLYNIFLGGDNYVSRLDGKSFFRRKKIIKYM